MKRVIGTPAALLLGLTMGLPKLVDVLVPAAQAQDRGERRVLRADDVNSQEAQSEELMRQAEEARMESIRRLKELISTTNPSGDTKAEMLLRLADLYFEQGRMLYLREMGEHQKKVDECFNTPKCDVASIQPDNTASREWQDKSIKLYKQILQAYPQYSRADDATFYLGQALSDTGAADEANKFFGDLVRNYPESRHVPDAYVLIGEYWFDKNEAFKALQAYQRAAAYKESDKYAFAMYKLSWCYYNVSEYSKAIETMKAVVTFSSTTTASGSDQKAAIQLMDEALKDLVRFYADAGDLDEAIIYFNKLGKKDLIRDVIKRLASTYMEQGKFDQAITTYRRLIAEDPQGAYAPEYQNEIVQAWTKIGNKQETINAIDTLRKNYGKNSAWAKANATNQDAIKQASEYIEKNLRTVALNYLTEAKKLKTGASATQAYTLAEQAFRVYLDEFPESKEIYAMRNSFAELLYTVKKFDEAYDQYMKVVQIDPKGQYSRFCARSAIFAADEVIKKVGRPASSSGPGAKKTDPVPLTEWETKLLAALDQFIKYFPEDKEVQTAIYRAGYIYYDHNMFKEMSDRFQIVIKMEPGSKKAMEAANLILDSFNLVEDWPNLKQASKGFYDQQGLGDADFKKEVYKIYENASLKLIEVEFAKGQDKSKAADAYFAFYQEFPTSENADLALNNASVYFRDLGRTKDSMRMRQELIGKFPKSKYYKDQVAALGYDFESIGDFTSAADWYEKLFALDAKHSGSSAAIFSAALFRSALGQWEQSIKDYQQYITAYPDKPNINGINIEIARIYEKHDRFAEASKVYLGFYSKPPVNATIGEIMFCRLRYGLLMDKINLGAKVNQHWKDSLAFLEDQKKKGADVSEGMEAAAQMMFILSEAQFQSYMNMKIDGPGDKKVPQKQADKMLLEQLRAKTKALAELEATYVNIVGTGAGEWGLASLTRLGQAYENMAESFLKSWIPSYLTEDQKEIYTMTLQDKAFPQIEKAVAAYSQALTKGFELSLYNDNTAFAARRLGELRPKEFPGLFETIPEVRRSAPSVYNASFETQP